MRKLLSANFARLWKSKVFWALEAIVFLWGTVMYCLVWLNVRNMGISWLEKNAGYYFFFILLYVGMPIAVFASLFIGTEYSDGSIRNKLTVGHRRRDVYLSNLIVSAVAALLFLLTHFLAAVIVGLPAVGTGVLKAVDALLLRALCALVVLFAYTSLFSLAAMLDSNKARCAVVSLFLVLALTLVGLGVYAALSEPELTSRMVMQEDGSFLRQKNLPNPRYISGRVRTLLEAVEAFLPGAQALRITADSGKFSLAGMAGTFALGALLTVLGIGIFQKKDIK